MESEVTQLFKQLALQLKTRHDNSKSSNVVNHEDEQQNPLDVSISKLSQSLNLDEQNSRVRVLDTALSLMCFKAPQVFDSVVEYQVKTIVSVLSASVGCKSVRCCGGEILQVGSSICFPDIDELVAVCLDVIGKLGGSRGGLIDSGVLSKMLIDAVVRSAASSSYYRHLYPFTFAVDVNSGKERVSAVSNLHCHLPKEFSFKSAGIPSRLFLWYLNPAILERDVTKILQDTMDRPFVCLYNELHDRKEWSSIIICLALAPVMFIEARALLHRWFLMTGLVSILEFLTELVSVILDVVCRPTLWGLPIEQGLKIPFSMAYFPYKHHFLQTLLGPFSTESLSNILLATSESVSPASIQPESTMKSAEVNIRRIDHKSTWALAINFSNWFHFASLLLFYEKGFQDKFYSDCTVDKLDVDGVELSSTQLAAQFISWILSPINKSHQHFLIDCLTTIAESWRLKQCVSSKNDKKTASHRKKLKKQKPEDHIKEFDCQAIRIWLEEFNSIGVPISRSACSETKSSYNLIPHQNILFRRIPLGIFIGYLNLIDVLGCELLLHYAATGRVLQLSETATAAFVNKNSESEECLLTWDIEINREEAVAGSRLVFMMTDWVESLSLSLFEKEEHALEFICQVKIKAGRFLIKCLNRLNQIINIDEDGILMLQDLFSRLVKWKQQGKESENPKELDDVINKLCHTLYSSCEFL